MIRSRARRYRLIAVLDRRLHAGAATTGLRTAQAGLSSGAAPAPGQSAARNAAPASNARAAERSTSPAGRVADAVARASGAPVLTAQVLGLIALALAFLLTVTRLSVRRRK